MDYLSDTTFLIDLWRERDGGGVATTFSAAHAEAIVAIPWIAKAEFLRGAFVAQQEHTAEIFLRSFQTVWASEGTIRVYAEIFSDLRAVKQMIGPHDLWIAASARELGLPLLTRNVEEFGRVRGLKIVEYT
jgi:tRNA(fMet)-specific endonuclease VapC